MLPDPYDTTAVTARATAARAAFGWALALRAIAWLRRGAARA